MTPETKERIEKEIEYLKDVLHVDQSGLAKGLAAVNELVEGYWWVTEGRGPYAWNDDEYKKEMGRMLENIKEVATTALKNSGTIAHTVCCQRQPRTVTIEGIGYIKKELSDKEIERVEKLIEALEEIEKVHMEYHKVNGDNPAANHLRNIAVEAIYKHKKETT